MKTKKYVGQMCCVCGEREAHRKDMCDRCYQKARRKALASSRKDKRSEQTKKIIEEYKGGKISQAALAKKYGISRQRVYVLIQRDKALNEAVDRNRLS